MKAPMVRQINWLVMGIHLAFLMTGLGLAAGVFGINQGVVLVALLYLILALLLRSVFSSHHRRGIVLLKRGQYEAAIGAFQKSENNYIRRPWVDRYRAFFMLSAASVTYREMALINMAFCYGQIGEGSKMRECYVKVLELNPKNAMATTSLRMIESAAEKRTSE